MTDHDKARRILLSRRKWHRTDCDCSECADNEVLSASIERCERLEAENAGLREALRGMVGLYDSDEGTRSLPEVVAARAALSSTGEKGGGDDAGIR